MKEPKYDLFNVEKINSYAGKYWIETLVLADLTMDEAREEASRYLKAIIRQRVER